MPVYQYDVEVILPPFIGPLKEILDAEIRQGNSVVEVSEGWPMKIANAWLAKRFHRDYKDMYPSLRYEYLGDPKNWIEDYIDVGNGLMVAVAAIAER